MRSQLITHIFYALGGFCFFYFLVLAIATGMNSFFHVIWLVFSLFFFVLGRIILMCRMNIIHIPAWMTGIACVAAGLLLALLLFVDGVILYHAAGNPDPGADYVIILGAQVKGKRPSLALASRLKAAKAYLDENPDTRVIVSGARGYGEDISEAGCMYQWLTERGISPDRILMEDASVNTDENIRFSRRLIGDDRAFVVIVTNSFHTFRAKAIAKKQGMVNVQSKSAATTYYMLPTYYLREAMAVIKYRLTGQI